MELNELHSDHEHASTSLKVVLLVFAVVLVLALGYLVWNQNVTTDTTDSSSTVIKKTTTTDPTADWETYTDTANGFSLKYPSDWFTSTKDGEGAVIIANFDYDHPAVPSLGHLTTTQTKRVVFVKDNPSNLSAEAFATSDGEVTSENTLDTKTVKVGAKSAIKYDLKPGISSVSSITYLALNNSKIIVFSVLENQVSVDDMIASFKFL